MNNLDPSIKLTWEDSYKTVNFLDLSIYRASDFHVSQRLECKVFQKPMNEYLYLPNNSYHTKDMKKGFIRGEAIRYVRNSSKRMHFNTILQQFRHRLMLRGYKVRFINKVLETVKYDDRETFLKDRPSALKTTPMVFKVQLNPAINLRHIRQQLLAFEQGIARLPNFNLKLEGRIILCQCVPAKLHDQINAARKTNLR